MWFFFVYNEIFILIWKSFEAKIDILNCKEHSKLCTFLTHSTDCWTCFFKKCLAKTTIDSNWQTVINGKGCGGVNNPFKRMDKLPRDVKDIKKLVCVITRDYEGFMRLKHSEPSKKSVLRKLPNLKKILLEIKSCIAKNDWWVDSVFVFLFKLKIWLQINGKIHGGFVCKVILKVESYCFKILFEFF